MGKRRASLSDAQMAFGFEPPVAAKHAGDLAGLTAMVAASVGRILKGDPRPREVIAAEMSVLLAEDVSRWMLDSWASEARELHNVSASRWLALIAVTARHDVLDAVLRQIGAAALAGDEINAARLGHLMTQRRDIDAQIRDLKPDVTTINRGTR